MGRFLNPGRAFAPPVDIPTRGTQTQGFATVAIEPALLPEPPTPAAVSAPTFETDRPPNMLHTIGWIAVCLSTLSLSLNELLYHLFNGKTYLFIVAFPVSLAAWLGCGTMLRSLRTLAGKMWLFLGVWLIICIAFSIWRSGSWEVVNGYLMRCHVTYFLLGAFALTIRQCRYLMYANVLSGFLLLLLCLRYGGAMENGRFHIEDSMFFSNPNDLALQLITLVGLFAFLLMAKNLVLRILGAGSLLLTAWYVLKTGSRGVFVASVVLVIVTFIVTKAKLKLAIMLVPIMLLVPLISPDTLHRLLLIATSPETAQIEDEHDQATVISQFERQHLFWLGLKLTLTNPIFGVGPGMFIDATSGADQRMGKHSPALGSHNSYTQIGSESGIPGLVAYVGVIVISIKKMLQLYRATAGVPALSDISRISYCLMLSLVGFAVAAFFHHVAYSGHVSLLAGMSMATWMAAQPALKRYTSTATTPPIAVNRLRIVQPGLAR